MFIVHEAYYEWFTEESFDKNGTLKFRFNKNRNINGRLWF